MGTRVFGKECKATRIYHQSQHHVKYRLTDTDQCDPRETNLILTEPSNATYALQSNCDQMVFEEFEFASCYRCVGLYIS